MDEIYGESLLALQRTTIVRADIKQQMRVVLDKIQPIVLAPARRGPLQQHRPTGRDICNDYFIGVLAVIFTNTVPHARAPSGAAATSL